MNLIIRKSIYSFLNFNIFSSLSQTRQLRGSFQKLGAHLNRESLQDVYLRDDLCELRRRWLYAVYAFHLERTDRRGRRIPLVGLYSRVLLSLPEFYFPFPSFTFPIRVLLSLPFLSAPPVAKVVLCIPIESASG